MRRIVPIAAACAAAIALASCASLQRSWDQNDVRKVVELLNKGESEKLAAMSVTPFLVDGEVVLLKGDVASFWDGVVKAGFRVDGAELDQGVKITAESYKQFADTMGQRREMMQRHHRERQSIDTPKAGG